MFPIVECLFPIVYLYLDCANYCSSIPRNFPRGIVSMSLQNQLQLLRKKKKSRLYILKEFKKLVIFFLNSKKTINLISLSLFLKYKKGYNCKLTKILPNVQKNKKTKKQKKHLQNNNKKPTHGSYPKIKIKIK